MSSQKTFKRGLVPTPRYKLLQTKLFRRLRAFPAQFAMVPKQLCMWGNDVYGDCVCAEYAAATAAYSTRFPGPERCITEAACVAWAKHHSYLNGAEITDVMNTLAVAGMPDTAAEYCICGPYQSVDWSIEPALESAISQGPVCLGIDGDALPAGAGHEQGWHAIGGMVGDYANYDHCIGLLGYGSASWLYGQLGVVLPAGLEADVPGYLALTYGTIGFVDHDWLMSCVGEAWLRTPTTVREDTVAA
jgi:hypothetical protein